MSNTYVTGEQTRKKILQVSKALFYQKGYTATTYSDISTAANVNRALIPYHFNTKQILGIEIHHEIIEEFYRLIDNVLDTSQFDSDFVSTLYIILYYRLLANNTHFSNYLSELMGDTTADLFSSEQEKNWLTRLGSKFATMNETELDVLTKMNIGIKKEMIDLLCNVSQHQEPDQIANIHIRVLMNYAGYSQNTIQELMDAALEVANLLTFEINDAFTIELKL